MNIGHDVTESHDTYITQLKQNAHDTYVTQLKQNTHSIRVGRCLLCGAVKVVRHNNYICPCCGGTMTDVDEMFKKGSDKNG